MYLIRVQTDPGLSPTGWLSLAIAALLFGSLSVASLPPPIRRFAVRRAGALIRRRAGPVVSSRPVGPVASSREPIPAGLRFAVLRRDGFRCAYCGRGETDGVRLHIDHLVPVARGGATTLDNLVTACQECNLGKSASELIGGPMTS